MYLLYNLTFPLWFRIGNNSSLTLIKPYKLISIISFESPLPIPALLTITSKPIYYYVNHYFKFLILFKSLTSNWCTKIFAFYVSLSIFIFASIPASYFLEVNIKSYSDANFFAKWSPSPLLAPVINTIFLFSIY